MFPQAIAIGKHPHRHHGREIEGRDPATTPNGWRRIKQSTPGLTSRISEDTNVGGEQANSTTSNPAECPRPLQPAVCHFRD